MENCCYIATSAKGKRNIGQLLFHLPKKGAAFGMEGWMVTAAAAGNRDPPSQSPQM